MYKRICLVVLALLVSACSTIPERIQVPEGTNLVSYQDAASKSTQLAGQKARWGGVVAKIENKAENTVLEVVYYPLKSYGRPIAGDESIGRFKVYVDGFMDPMVYKVGRSMTFTGEFSGLEEGLVGEHKYVFPTLQNANYYLWQDIQQVDVTSVHVWPYDYWSGWYPRPYTRGVYIRSTGRATMPAGAATKPLPVKTERAKQ
ncbi:Slp family lipoprotein [Paraglaciecola sp.]|uniref:Slp family lipoprotein n=1 Tax=Pseudomonadati TaxID=3379134 RepID=UPI00273D4A39|nr:Slp family lipoprotein [Paraglaciecola sp.]MDP5028910.1 Slp family lipoprotein [Paraglaciecola sp.]